MLTQQISSDLKEILKYLPSNGSLINKKQSANTIRRLLTIRDHKTDADVLYRVIMNLPQYTFTDSSIGYINKYTLIQLIEFITSD